MTRSMPLRAAIVSVLLFLTFVTAWHIATSGTGAVQQMDPEYAKLMGATATHGKSAMPGPLDVDASSGSTCASRSMTKVRMTKASASSSPIRSRG